jgi:hypothetical protein
MNTVEVSLSIEATPPPPFLRPKYNATDTVVKFRLLNRKCIDKNPVQNFILLENSFLNVYIAWDIDCVVR